MIFGRQKTDEVAPAEVAHLQASGAVLGGMSAWASSGRPVVRDDGSPGRVS